MAGTGRTQWKVFWSVLGAVFVLAGAVLPTLAGVPWWLTSLAAVAVAVICMVAAREVVFRSPMFAGVPTAQTSIARWIAGAIGLNTVWLILFVKAPHLWYVWLPALVGLVGLEYGFARGQEYVLLRLKSRGEARNELVVAQEHPLKPRVTQTWSDGTVRVLDEVEGQFARALRMAGFDWLLIMDYAEVAEEGKDPFGYRFRVRTPSRQALIEMGKNKVAATRTLDAADAEDIAIALGELLEQQLAGEPFMSDYVQIESDPAAGVWQVLVVFEDILARVFPYVDNPGWASIRKPARMGFGRDGKSYDMVVRAHGQIIGGSTWGKSSLINDLIAFLTRCVDTVVWVGGVRKLYDLVGPWIEPFMDLDEDLPLDWIANGQTDTLDMLAAAMRVAKWRQSVPTHLRKPWPTIIVILDECSDTLQNYTDLVVFEGQHCNASSLAAKITKGAASAGVYIWLATQRSTNDNFGEYGGDITANIAWSAAFRSQDDAETGRLTGNYKLPMPRHKGAYWLKPVDADLPVQLKAEYIQPNDSSKDHVHDGITLNEVAMARRGLHTGLDSGSARAAGPAYANRRTRMNTDLLVYLTGFTEVSGDGDDSAVGMPGHPERPALAAAVNGEEGAHGVATGPGSSAHEAGLAQVREMLLAAGHTPMSSVLTGPPTGDGEPALAPPAGGDVGSTVTELADRRTRPQRILDILAEAGRPLERVDIIAELHRSGDLRAGPQAVTNDLTRLRDKLQITRLPEGGWVLAAATVGR